MKVLFHVPFTDIGGAELQLKYLIRHMEPEIKCSVTYEYAQAETFVKSLKVPFYRVYSPLSLAKTIDTQIRPDIVHFYHSRTMHAALGKLHKRPKTYEVIHNRLPFPRDGMGYGKNHTDAVVCVSDDARALFESKMPGLNAIVIPNGVDETKFFIKNDFVKTPRARPLGGFTGRLEAGDGKGLPELIEVLSSMEGEVDFELVGKDYGGYEQLIKSKGIKNIKVLPFTENPESYYRNWDFFVSASPAEGFGLSIAEAISCGVPSIIKRCGGVCNYIAHGQDALLVDSKEQMIRAICEAAFSGWKPSQKFDLTSKKMADSYKSLYRELMGSPEKLPTAITVQERVKEVAGESLAVTPSDWYGVRRALAPLTDAHADPRDAFSMLRRMKPKIVVFGCYMPSWEKVLLEARKLGCKTVLTWHASYILNEFDHINREWMFHALKAAKNKLFDFVATPHEGLAEAWSHYGIPTDFLPNVVEHHLIEQPKLPGLNIGILGSGQPWKNMDCQVIAASISGAKVHIQKIRHPQSLESLDITVNKHPHINSDADYYALVGSMKINMCVSLSEVYSYFVAESLMLGTPVLTGSITPILKKAPEVLQVCRTPYFEDPMEMVRSIEEILENYDEIRSVGMAYMSDLNNSNKKIVKSVLDKWRTHANL